VYFFLLPEELEEEKVAVVSLYPGIVKTEKMVGLMTKSPKDFEANVRLGTHGGGRRDPFGGAVVQNLCCVENSGFLHSFVSKGQVLVERSAT